MLRVVAQSVAVLVCGWFLLLGCTMPMSVPVAQTTGPCMGGPSGNVAGFEVSVKQAKWTDHITPPAYEFIPKAQLSMYQSQASIHPQSTFLVVNLNIVNTTNAPLAWNNPTGGYTATYKLVSPQGTQYEYDQRNSSIIMKTGLGNQNPGANVSGTVVFDVPKGPYTFMILQERYQRLPGYIRANQAPVFQCSISL